MELQFYEPYTFVPEDYSGDNKIFKANIGGRFRVEFANKYKLDCRFEFRHADDCTKDFIRYGGQILNKENVWNAYMKLSSVLEQLRKGNMCQSVKVYTRGCIYLCCCADFSAQARDFGGSR